MLHSVGYQIFYRNDFQIISFIGFLLIFFSNFQSIFKLFFKTFLFPWCLIVVTVPAMRLTFTAHVMHTWWISPSSQNLLNRCMEIMVLYVSHNGNEIKFNEISICLIDHSCNEINELVYLIYLINSCNVGYRSCVPASRSTQLQWLDAQSQNKGCK